MLSLSFNDYHLELSKYYKYAIESPRTKIESYHMKRLKKSKKMNSKFNMFKESKRTLSLQESKT